MRLNYSKLTPPFGGVRQSGLNDVTLDYRDVDVAAEVKRLTGGRR